jgi:hypothetical protein
VLQARLFCIYPGHPCCCWPNWKDHLSLDSAPLLLKDEREKKERGAAEEEYCMQSEIVQEIQE